MLTQGGVVPYVLVRDRGFEDFSRLIDRERIELVQPRFQSDGLPGGQPLSVRIDRPFEAAQFANLPQIRQERNTSFQALLRDLYDQIERDRLENLVVLVPPGGLPPGLEQSLTVFKAKLAKGVDVRLDIAIVGSESIPTTLRDLCARSGGSVLSVTDIDEIGAIAQRLKNEQSSGSWIIIPQQSTIPQLQDQVSVSAEEANKQNEDLKSVLVDADGRLKKILSASLAPSVKTSAEGTITLVNQIQNNLDQIQANLKNLKTPPAGTKIKDLVISAYKLQSAFRFQITRTKDVIKSASQLPPTDDPAKDILKLVDELQSENKLGKNLAWMPTEGEPANHMAIDTITLSVVDSILPLDFKVIPISRGSTHAPSTLADLWT